MEEKKGRQRFNKSIGLSVLPPLQQMPLFTQTESASFAEAQRAIESLQKENEKLREQLHDVSSLYKKLVMENEHENFSERRVNLLKSQNIQLKRQILVLTEAIGSRASVQLEVENALGTIADHCRTHLDTRDRLGEVSVRLSDLKLLVETAESARIKLYKNIENTATQNLQRPLMFMDHFVRHHPDKPVTIMDVCSGHLEHLNLKDIAKLESKLAELYKQMMAVNQSLQMIVSPDKGPANHELPLALYARLWGQVSKTCSMLKESSGELLELCVLVPAAPWPLLHRPMVKELTVDAVMERLPNFPRSKVNDAREIIQALLRAMAYTTRTKHAENKLLKEEVDFHRAVYQLQLDYIQTFFSALREGYRTFEQVTNELLCEPLKAILEAYSILQRTAAEDPLRNFLTVFKLNVTQVSEAIKKLAPKDNKGRDEALSDFGQHFFQSIDQLRADSQGKRDNLIGDLDYVTTQQQEAIEHIIELMCGDTIKDNQGYLSKIKTSNSSGKSAIEITTEKSCDSNGKSFIEITTAKTHNVKKQSGFTRDNIEHGVPSGQVDDEQLVKDKEKSDVIEDTSPTKAASEMRVEGDTPRARKKWMEPTRRPLSAASRTSSPLLTSRAKQRSVPRKGIAQPKLVLPRPKLAEATTTDRKGKQPVADLDIALTEDDTGRSQSRSRSVNRSPNEYSKRSQWK